MRSRTFHCHPQFPASKERGCQPSFRGIFHSLTCQLSSLPREEFSTPQLQQNEGTATAPANPPKNGLPSSIWQAHPKSPQPRAPTLCFLTLAQLRHAFISEAFKALWDANSTPVCWGCQEGIPIYCISVLASGMLPPVPRFFHKATHFRVPRKIRWHDGAVPPGFAIVRFSVACQVAAQTSDAAHASISARAEVRRFRSEMGKFRRFSRGHFSTAGPMAT